MTERIYLAPRSNETAYNNLQSTVIHGKPFSSIAHLIHPDGHKILGNPERVYAWGNVENLKKRWDGMSPGDLILFYARGEFVYAARCLYKQLSSEISDIFWPRSKKIHKPWSCIFFLRDIKPVKIPISEIRELGGYRFDRVQGFQSVNQKCVDGIIAKYGSTEAFINSYLSTAPTKNSKLRKQINFKRFKENARDAGFQLDVQEAHPAPALPPGPLPAKNKTVKRGYEAFSRNPGIAKRRLEEAGYKCEVDDKHGTFISRATNRPYIEAHHLVPVGRQGDFPNVDLDVPENILALCPLCHRRFHHAIHAPDYKLIDEFLERKKELLRFRGIAISREQLRSYYSDEVIQE